MVRALKVLGWLSMVAGLFACLIQLGSQSAYPSEGDPIGIFIGFVYFMSGVAIGILLLGAAEGISLLREIRDNTKYNNNPTSGA